MGREEPQGSSGGAFSSHFDLSELVRGNGSEVTTIGNDAFNAFD